MIVGIAVVLCSILLGQVNSQARVCIPDLGCVQGTEMPGYQAGEFEAFMGISFLEPPNPKPAEPWEGDWNATAPRSDCIQKNYLLPTPIIYGAEDCFYLNTRDPKPMFVMVYIYGGGFFAGSASPLVHGPEYFMDTSEVILVTVAYRLGALGFLSTGDKHIPAFDFDPEIVTIFGQSAGAVSVHFHVLSKLSQGLFKKAIVVSGNAAAPFANPIPDALTQARKQAELCDIPDASSLSPEKLVAALRKVDATELVNSGDGFKYWSVDPLTTFRPVIEPASKNAFITQNPKDIISSGAYEKVPWMMGMVLNEGAVRALAILTDDHLRNDFNLHFDDLFNKLIELPPNDDTEEKLKLINDFYFKGVHELDTNTSQSFINSITDREFAHSFIKSLRQYVGNGNLVSSPVYLYRFNYRGSVSYSMIYTGRLDVYGVVHCDDLIYLFRSPLLFQKDFDKGSTEAKVIKGMVDIYISFTKTGKPKLDFEMKDCNKDSMNQENTICDYWEIRNKDDSFKVQIHSAFDKSLIELWDKIL